MARTILALFLLWAAPSWGEERPHALTSTQVPTSSATPTPSPRPALSWRPVERVLDREGEASGERLRLSFPRYDLNLMIEGVALEPQMVESLLYFTALFDGAAPAGRVRVEGRLMVLDREAPRVVERLLEAGFEVLGLEGPFLNASPAMKLVRFAGQGSAERVAQDLKRALRGTGILQGPAPPRIEPTPRPTPAPKALSPLVEGTFGAGVREGSTLRYSQRFGEGFERILRFQGEGERFAVCGDWILAPEGSGKLLKAFARVGLKPSALWKEEGGMRLRFWYSGPPQEVLPILLREWGRPDAAPDP